MGHLQLADSAAVAVGCLTCSVLPGGAMRAVPAAGHMRSVSFTIAFRYFI
jgi:hypothetical protein